MMGYAALFLALGGFALMGGGLIRFADPEGRAGLGAMLAVLVGALGAAAGLLVGAALAIGRLF